MYFELLKLIRMLVITDRASWSDAETEVIWKYFGDVIRGTKKKVPGNYNWRIHICYKQLTEWILI